MSKLEPYKPYLMERLKAGVWNAQVLLRELRHQRNCSGGYTILTDWLRPRRAAAQVVAVERLEKAPGNQAQVDWGHLGLIADDGEGHPLWGFTMTLGYNSIMMAEAATDQKLRTLLRMHERAFQQWDGVPEEILYDRMRAIWTGTDERGEIIWNAVFVDFARYWGFTPRLCRPYRAPRRAKWNRREVRAAELSVRLAGPRARPPRRSERRVAPLGGGCCHQRVHGTTREQVQLRSKQDQSSLQRNRGLPSYPYADNEQRKVARDA